MDLEWITRQPFDADGQCFVVHYLIDSQTAQCFATIAEPRHGHILYETDIKVSGYDRSYITLDAKQHCEVTAVSYEEEQRKALEDTMKVTEPAKVTQ